MGSENDQSPRDFSGGQGVKCFVCAFEIKPPGYEFVDFQFSSQIEFYHAREVVPCSRASVFAAAQDAFVGLEVAGVKCDGGAGWGQADEQALAPGCQTVPRLIDDLRVADCYK